MKKFVISLAGAFLALGVLASGSLHGQTASTRPWHKQPWDESRIKPCDRACLVQIIDGYVTSVLKKDPASVPTSEETWYTENTARLDIGEGVLWRASVEPTGFKIHAADPVNGQVALQAVFNIEGRPALTVIRLKVERRHITEIEHLVDRNVAKEAMELLTTPRPGLLADIAPSERTSREVMIWAANSYFDALTGDDGSIGAFADTCVRHENGYQTVKNEKPGRAAPSPALPNTSTPIGRAFSKLSMMSCAEQLNTGIFSGIKKIWPRRVLIIDEQKGLAAAFPLFIHDGTRRPGELKNLPDMPPQRGLAMMVNMVTMETFKIRSGKIHEVEVFPFITFNYGLGDGWTPAAGR
jgi:hypothetical protein